MSDWSSLHRNYTVERTKTIRDLQLFSDVTVLVQGVEFPCHRFLLAASSDFFWSLFTQQTETQHFEGEVVDIDVTTPELFSAILDALYTDQDPVTHLNAVQLLKAASCLHIQSLVQHCEKSVIDYLHKSKIRAEVLILDPDMADYPKITQSALDVLLSDFGPAVLKTEWFLGLSREHLLLVLDDPRLNVRDEDEVYRALMEWYEHDPKSREDFLEKALDSIRLVNLSRRVLVEEVLGLQFCQNRLGLRGEKWDGGDKTIGDSGNGEGEEEGKMFQQVQRALAYHLLPDRRHIEVLRYAEFRPSQAYERVVLVMGDQSDRLYAFSLARQGWFKLAAPPRPLGLGLVACTHGDDVYVTGGSKAMTSCWRFRPATNSWKQLPDMNVGRRSHACVAVEDAIYVLGGKVDSKPIHSDTLDSVEVLQIRRRKEGWKKLDVSLPVPVRSAAAAVIDAKIYLIGGRTNGFQKTMTTVQCVDTATLQSCVISHLPQPSCLARPFFAHNVLYIIDTNGDVLRFTSGRPNKSGNLKEERQSTLETISTGVTSLDPRQAVKEGNSCESANSRGGASGTPEDSTDLKDKSQEVTANSPSNGQDKDGYSGNIGGTELWSNPNRGYALNESPKSYGSISSDRTPSTSAEHLNSLASNGQPGGAARDGQAQQKDAKRAEDTSTSAIVTELYSNEQNAFVKMGSIKNVNWKWFGAARNYDGTVYVIAGDLSQKAAPPSLSIASTPDESVMNRVRFIRPEKMGMCYMDVHVCIPKSFLLEKVV